MCLLLFGTACEDSSTLISEPTPSTASDAVTAEDFEELLAGLSDEQRAIAQLISQAEFDCFLSRLEDADFIEAHEESNQEASVALIEVWTEFWEPCITPERDADILLGSLEEYYGKLSPETEACIREKIRQNQDSHPGYRYRALVASSATAYTCLNESEDLEGEISLFARLVGGPITASERACLRQVATDTDGFLYAAVADIGRGRSEHVAFDCFTKERIVEFRVQRFSSREGYENLADGEMECVKQTFIQAELVRGGLDTEESRRSAYSMFDFAATYGFLSSERLNSLASGSGLNSSGGKTDFECVRMLSRETFPELYEEKIGLRMFGNEADLSPEEYAALASFAAELEECLLPDF